MFIDDNTISTISTIFLAISSGFFINYLYNIKKVYIESTTKDDLVLNSMGIFYEMKVLADELLKEKEFNEKTLKKIHTLARKIESIVPIVAFLKPEILHSFQLAQLQISELEIFAAKNIMPTAIESLSQLDGIYRAQENELFIHNNVFLKLKMKGFDIFYHGKQHFFEDGIELQKAYIKYTDNIRLLAQDAKL